MNLLQMTKRYMLSPFECVFRFNPHKIDYLFVFEWAVLN